MTRAPRFAQVDPRHPLQAAMLPLLAAAVALAAVFAGLFYFTRPRVVADGSIVRSESYSVHSVAKANLGGPGTLGEAEVSDQTYVYCVVRLKNELEKLPLYVRDATATLTTADGREMQGSTASASDIPRFFAAFPAAPKLPETPLRNEEEIGAGRSVEGLVLVHFPVSSDVWQQRKGAALTVGFYQQAPLTFAISAGD